MKSNKLISRLLTILLTVAMLITGMSFAAFADVDPLTGEDIVTEQADTDAVSDSEVPNGLDEGGYFPGGYPSIPSEPENIAISYSGTKATIMWDAQAEDIYYVVKVGTSDADESVLSQSGIATPGVTFSFAKNTVYYVRVGAYSSIDVPENAVYPAVPHEFVVYTIGKPTITDFTYKVATAFASQTKNLRADNLATIKWKKPTTGTVGGYALVVDGKVKKKLDASVTKYTFRLAAGKNHTYAIKAYCAFDKTINATSSSKKVSKKILNFINKAHPKFSWNVKFKRKATLYKSSTGTAKLATIAKGKKGVAIGKYPKKVGPWDNPKRVQVEFEDGTIGWAKWGDVTVKADTAVKRDYPVSIKEEHANKYSSGTSQLIWVNEYTQRINIFKGKKGSWKLVRSSRCTTGRFASPITRGTKKKLGVKRGTVYRVDENGRSYFFRLARGFKGSGYFHTRCWWTDTGRPRNNVTSFPSTRGCIRMYNPDAQYVWSMPGGSKILFQ